MSGIYLPVKESLGYKNVKTALWNVFGVDLDTVSIHVGENENFNFPFEYKKYKMTMGIFSTGKQIQFEFGEGGEFGVLFPNPKYPEHSFLRKEFFHNLISDKHLSEQVEYAFGKDEQSLERALKILKNFLDSDEAKEFYT